MNTKKVHVGYALYGCANSRDCILGRLSDEEFMLFD